MVSECLKFDVLCFSQVWVEITGSNYLFSVAIPRSAHNMNYMYHFYHACNRSEYVKTQSGKNINIKYMLNCKALSEFYLFYEHSFTKLRTAIRSQFIGYQTKAPQSKTTTGFLRDFPFPQPYQISFFLTRFTKKLLHEEIHI